jgi:hypothetical protein
MTDTDRISGDAKEGRAAMKRVILRALSDHIGSEECCIENAKVEEADGKLIYTATVRLTGLACFTATITE